MTSKIADRSLVPTPVQAVVITPFTCTSTLQMSVAPASGTSFHWIVDHFPYGIVPQVAVTGGRCRGDADLVRARVHAESEAWVVVAGLLAAQRHVEGRRAVLRLHRELELQRRRRRCDGELRECVVSI